MINLFNIEDLEKYPELHIEIMDLVENWLDKQLKLERNKPELNKSRLLHKKIYKRLSMSKVVDISARMAMQLFLSKLLIENIIYHLIKNGDPSRYQDIIRIIQSKNVFKIKKDYDLPTLLSVYLNIAKNRIDDSIHTKNLWRSTIGQNDLFTEASKVLIENKKNNYRYTKKDALRNANDKFKVFSEELINNKMFMNKLENRFKQFEQREAKKKIKKLIV